MLSVALGVRGSVLVGVDVRLSGSVERSVRRTTVQNSFENCSTYQIQSEYRDEQADAGRDCRTRLARPNSQARTGTGKY